MINIKGKRPLNLYPNFLFFLNNNMFSFVDVELYYRINMEDLMAYKNEETKDEALEDLV